MKKNEVTTLTSLVNEGKKIARLSGNRDLNEKIVKAKMETLEECGQLIPAIVVDATDVINQGLEGLLSLGKDEVAGSIPASSSTWEPTVENSAVGLFI